MAQTMSTDLYATKGMEYILVIFFLLALIAFWRWLGATPRGAVAAGSARSAARGWFGLRGDRLYHPAHTWARVESDGTLTVGLDDFSQRLLGAPSRVELPSAGTRVHQGEPGWTLQVNGREFPILSPVDGSVLSRNDAVLTDPGLINREPYDEGWLLKVRPERGRGKISHLLSGPVADAWLAQSELSLRRRLAPDLGLVMQDGGVPVSGIARAASPEGWDELVREFLLTKE